MAMTSSLLEIEELRTWVCDRRIVEDEQPLRIAKRHFGSWFARRAFPPALQRHVQAQPPATIAVSLNASLLAFLFGSDLEVYTLADHYTTCVGRCRVLAETAGCRWRRLVWSASNALLVLARATPVIDVFDTAANYLYSIPLSGQDVLNSSSFDPLDSIAALQSKIDKTSQKYSDELYVLQYGGILHGFRLGRNSGFHRFLRAEVCPTPYDLLATQMCMHEGLLILGGSSYGTEVDRQTDAAACGVTLFRLTDSDVVQVETSKKPRRRPWSFWSSTEVTCVAQLCTSPDGSKAAVVLTDSTIVLLELPSLRIECYIPLLQQPSLSGNVTGACRLSNVQWWSNEELLLLRESGLVLVCNANEDLTPAQEDEEDNLVAPKSFLLRVPTSAHGGHCVTLEATNGDDAAAVKVEHSLAYRVVKSSWTFALGRSNSESEAAEDAREVTLTVQSLKASTPEDLFVKKLDVKAYDEALKLAHAYDDIHVDRIHQHAWRHGAQTAENVRETLGCIEEIDWVLQQCIDCVPRDADACRALLDLGLGLTSEAAIRALHKNNHSPSLDLLDDLEKFTDRQKHFLQCRAMLLRFSDALDDFLDDCNEDVLDWEVYITERRRHPIDKCVEEAREFETACDLRRYFERYERLLQPIWLSVLNEIPEVIDVGEFEELLPMAQNGEVAFELENTPRRPTIDFVESTASYAPLLAQFEAQFTPSPDLYLDEFTAAETVADWILSRARHIDAVTHMPDLTMQFLDTMNERGFEEVTEFPLKQMAVVCLLNYECHTEITLSQLEERSPLQVAQLVLNSVTADQFAVVFTEILMPYLEGLPNDVDSSDVLLEYIQSCTENGAMRHILRLLLALKNQEDDVLDVSELCICVCQACESCNDPAETDTICRIVTTLRTHVEEDDVHISDDADGALERLEHILALLDLLSPHGVTLSFAEAIRQTADDGAVEKLVKRMLNRDLSNALETSRRQKESQEVQRKSSVSPPPSTNWLALLHDARQLCDLARSPQTLATCSNLLLYTLLNSGDLDTITAASSFIAPTDSDEVGSLFVNRSDAIDAISVAAESYINSAADAADYSLECAQLCLNLLPDLPDQLRDQLDFVQGLVLLRSFGVDDLPARVLMHPDRVHYIRKVLYARSSSYKELAKLTRLAELLRVVPTEGCALKENILILCAERALDERDTYTCAKYARRLVEDDCGAGRSIVEKLALNNEYNDDASKLEFVAFALRFAAADEFDDLIRQCNALKLRLLDDSLENDRSFTEIMPDSLKLLGSTTDAALKHVSQLPDNLRLLTKTASGDGAFKSPTERIVETAKDFLKSHAFLQSTESPTQDLCISTRWKTDFELKYEKIFHALVSLWRISVIGGLEKEICVKHDLSHLIRLTFHHDPSFSLALLLTIEEQSEADDLLLSIPSTSQKNQLHQAFCAARILRDASVHTNLSDLSKLIEEARLILPSCRNDDIVTAFQQLDSENRKMERTTELSDLSVDSSRFVGDAQYRRETILGLAMMHTEDDFERAMTLAADYGVSQADVRLAALEAVLTDDCIAPADARSFIKDRGLISVAEDHDKIVAALQENVWPLLSGTNYNSLLLYFWTIALCKTEYTARAKGHLKMLQKVQQSLDGLDYRALISKENAMSTVQKYVSKSNLKNLLAVVANLPIEDRHLQQGDLGICLIQKMAAESEDVYSTISDTSLTPLLSKLSQPSFERISFILLPMSSASLQARIVLVDFLVDFARSQEFFIERLERVAGFLHFLQTEEERFLKKIGPKIFAKLVVFTGEDPAFIPSLVSEGAIRRAPSAKFLMENLPPSFKPKAVSVLAACDKTCRALSDDAFCRKHSIHYKAFCEYLKTLREEWEECRTFLEEVVWNEEENTQCKEYVAVIRAIVENDDS